MMPQSDQRDRDASADIWMVMAILQPFRLDAVMLALEAIEGFGGMTVTNCRGFGHEKVVKDREGRAQPQASVVDFVDKVKLEVVAASRLNADAIVDAIARTAHTGNRGDGKIFSWPVSRAVRVRTFEEGLTAV